MFRRIGFVALLVLTCLVPATSAEQAGTLPAPQQPSLTFRKIANYVEVDAVVTNANGDPVRDLGCNDFEVLEDNRPQRLDVCAFVDIPITPSASSIVGSAGRPEVPVERDVVTNEKIADGRVFMIVLDGLHVSNVLGSRVKNHAIQFIEKYLGSDDLAAVVLVGNSAAGQEFTSNKRLLRAAVERFVAQGLPSMTVNTNKDALNKDQLQRDTGALLESGPPVDPDVRMREFMARESLDAVRRLSEYMSQLNGRRKALLMFSEGISINALQAPQDHGNLLGYQSAPPDADMVLAMQRQMLAAATRANVSIYTIDPRGLTTGQEDIAVAGPMTSSGGLAYRDYLNTHIGQDLQSEVRVQQDALRTYAEQTGGLAMVDKNDIDEAFGRILQDNSSYYVLGYGSPDPNHDGRYHRLSVKVMRPGLKIRTKSGYFAPDDKPEPKGDAIVTMLRSPAPLGGLGMHVTASVLKTLLQKCTVHVTVEFSGTDVPLKRSGNLFTNDIEIEYLALDMKGTGQANGREIAHLQLQPARQAGFLANGVRYMTEFPLAPGRYQLRIAAREQLGGRAGSVFYDLDVPDISNMRLAMSDLMITTSSARSTATSQQTSTVGGVFNTPTTTVRTFSPGETMTMAVSLYDNDDRAAHEVSYKVSVVSEAGTAVFTRDDHRDASTMRAVAGGYSWVVEVPLKDLPAGRYVLSVEARSSLADFRGPTDEVRRAIEFRIR